MHSNWTTKYLLVERGSEFFLFSWFIRICEALSVYSGHLCIVDYLLSYDVSARNVRFDASSMHGASVLTYLESDVD